MKTLVAVLACVIALGSLASAQSSLTGAIQGVVSDKTTGRPLARGKVIAVATSPTQIVGQTGPHVAVTDRRGGFRLANLPPGTYQLTYRYRDLTIERTGVWVALGKAVPVFQIMDLRQRGQTIRIHDKPPGL